MTDGDRPLRCLVTGATGYIGGRLVPELLAAGHPVRCLTRSSARLRDRPWSGRVEAARGDVRDPASVRAAMEGVDVAYYLVHALGSGRDFEETDRRAAGVFGEQARAAGIRRIVYLGGLTPSGVPERALSPHLRSRSEVGRVLLDSGVPTAVLRAAMIIGAGSVPFEMLRYLTERLPVVVTPDWVRTRTQPIAVRDVLRLLVGCARLPRDVHRTFDIGGPDIVTYQDMMRRYAAVASLPRRLIMPVPLLTPRLSSLWVGLVTPVPNALARPLVESLRYEVTCGERDIAGFVPDPRAGPLGLDESLRTALQRVRGMDATPLVRGADADPLARGADADPLARGTDAGPPARGTDADPLARGTDPLGQDAGLLAGGAGASPPRRTPSAHSERPAHSGRPARPARVQASAPHAPGDPQPTDPRWAGGSLYTDHRERTVTASPQALWQVVEGIGGDNGWYSSPWAWSLRGWLDTLVGGVGLRRGRPDAARLRAGDFLDFWRVEAIEPGRLLRLRAEMRLPGLAWLEMTVDRAENGRAVYRQRALFHPHGLAGHAYWWAIAPFHAAVFGGMARNIASAAESGPVRTA